MVSMTEGFAVAGAAAVVIVLSHVVYWVVQDTRERRTRDLYPDDKNPWRPA